MAMAMIPGRILIGHQTTADLGSCGGGQVGTADPDIWGIGFIALIAGDPGAITVTGYDGSDNIFCELVVRHMPAGSN